jgi:RimJ/RimL family protein N-acetyltransferase
LHRIDTERLHLVPFAPEHLDPLHALWTDADVRRYLWDDEVISRDRAAEVIAISRASFETRGFGFWALFPRDAPETLMGFCGFRAFEETGEPELLFGILPAYWGKGFVSEAAHAAIVDGFERCAFQRIVAATDTPNQSSVRVMQRLGMVFDGRREFHGLDTIFYSLTPADHADHQALAAGRP